MSVELTRYDTAKRALSEARHVDEVKDIHDKAVAMQVYAKQAKDTVLIEYATEIRMRAEIRAGELLAEMAERKERHAGKAPKGLRVATPTPQPKLSDLGVSKTQSSRWQKLAALPKEEQEAKVDLAKRKAEAAVAPPPPKASDRPKSSKKMKPRPDLIGPLDRCTMRVRATVLEIVREMQPSEWPELFAALHDELDDIEKVAEQMKEKNGHYASRQSA